MHRGAEHHATPAGHEEALTRLGELFCRAVRSLGQAGRAELANRLAAKAWWATRDPAPHVAQHVNGVMHFLATLPTTPTPHREEPSMDTPELDVRSEPPARRHELILSTYDGLAPAEGFVLVNDHDPKPLYYQFDAEHPGKFTWDYLETGPEVWKVRIGKPA